MGQTKLELLLSAKDKNLSSTVKSAIKLFKSLEQESNNLDKSLNKLFKQRKFSFSGKFTSEIRKANNEAQKLKKTFDSLSNIKIKTPKIDSQISSKTSSPKQAESEINKLFNKTRKSKSPLKRLARLNENYIEPAGQIKNIWKDEYDSLKQYTDEAKKLYLAQAKFKLVNLSPEENKRAFEAVNEVVRKFGTVTRTEGIETLTDLHTALGSLPHAIEALEKAAQYRFSMKTLFGDKFSDSEIEERIQNAYKFLEVTGKVNKGKEEMDRSFNVLTQMTTATGGRVTPSEMLLMARRGGTSLQGLTSQGLRNLSMVIQELGGSGTGVALESTFAALVGGIMKQSSSAEFDRLGLIDRSKIEYGKAQQIKKVLPGANRLGDLAMADPLSAADTLRDAMKAKGINTDNVNDVNKELYILFQNRNARKMMSLLMNQRSQVTKEANLAANSQGNDAMFEKMPDELKKIEQFENAIKNFKTEAGIPLIEIGGKLASSLTPILNFFGEHPTITQWAMSMMLAGKAIKTVSETASILSGTGSGLASFFSNTAGGASNATTKVSGLSSKLNSLPSSIKFSLVAALVGFTWDQLDKIKELSEQNKSNQSNIDSAAQGTYKAQQQENTTLKANNQTPDYKDRLKNVIDLLQVGKNKEFEIAVDPNRMDWKTRFSRNLGYLMGADASPSLFKGSYDIMEKNRGTKFTDYPQEYQEINKLPDNLKLVGGMFGTLLERYAAEQVAPKNLQNRVPMLEDPTLMAKFRQESLPSFGFGEIQKQWVEQMLQKAFPKSYEQSNQQIAEKSNQLTQAFTGLQQPSINLGEQFSMLNTKTSPLGEIFSGLTTNSNAAINSIFNLGGGAQNVANRLSNLEIKPPTFSPIRIPLYSDNTSGKKSPSVVDDFLNGANGRARGGSVKKGSTYRINEIGQEFFTPNQNGSIVSNDILRNSGRGNSRTSPTVINATFHISAETSKDADVIAKKVLRTLEELQADVSKLKVETSPRRTAQKTAYYANRDSELT